MSPRFRFVARLFAFAVLTACRAEVSLGTTEHVDAPRAPAPLAPSPAPAVEPPALVATAGDVLVVVDPSTGELLGEAPLAIADGGRDLDVTWLEGPEQGWAVVRAQTSVDELSGSVVAYPIAPSGAVGVPRRLGEVFGETSVLATPFGFVVTQEDMGERWRLIPTGGGFTPSVVCGRPLSVRTVSVDSDAARFEALSFWPEGELSSLDVEVGAERVATCSARAIVGFDDASPSVRMVELGTGYTRALADVSGDALVVAALDAEEVVSVVSTPFGSTRLEGALRLALHDDTTDLVLLGSAPSRLAWVRLSLDASGDLAIAAARVIALEAEIPWAERTPGRSLAVAGRDVVVATASGIEIFSTDESSGELLGEPRRHSGLSGPIGTVALP